MALPLVDRRTVAHDVVLLTFRLPDPNAPLGLSTCACLLARGAGAGPSEDPAAAEPTIRPYTPVSTNAMLGNFQLMVKVYPDGALSQHLAELPLGRSVDFKHIPVNVKRQYPFDVRELVMIAGGTGITPMIQALHAVLGTRGDTTRVTLLYSNKEEKDILLRELLDVWASELSHRFRIVHTLTREPSDSSWDGKRGRIDRPFLEEHLPSSKTSVLIFVCGPPGMYDSLSGPRGEKGLAGVLSNLGYSDSQVVKF
jgi:cytochrome-b5 reductase